MVGAQIGSWLEEVLPGVRAEIMVIEPGINAPGDLWPVEEEAIAKAVDARRLEFALGRWCARQALDRLGGPAVAIAVGADRAPVWPPGYVGSIAHTRGLVGALAGRLDDVRSLGLDIERAGAVESQIWPQVLTPGERERCLAEPDGDPATVIFSVKEAVYKATHPVARCWLGFEDVDVELDPDRGRFEARIGPDVAHPMAAQRFDGWFVHVHDHVVAALALPAPS